MSDLPTSATTRPPANPDAKMDIGRVFRETYRAFRAAPARLVGIALLPLAVSVITALPGLFQNPQNRDPSFAVGLAIVSLVMTLVQYVVQITCQGASIYAGTRLLAGSGFAVGEALRVGFRRFLPMLGLFVLMILILIVGFLLFVIPALIAGCVLAVALQACVLERQGPIESMKRSAFLTKGNRWRVIGAYFLTTVPVFIGFGVVAALGVGAFALYQTNGLSPSTIALAVVCGLLLILVTFVGIGIGGPFLAALFVELRQIKEGIGSRDAVAGVFD